MGKFDWTNLMKALGRHWHQSCLRCVACTCRLPEVCIIILFFILFFFTLIILFFIFFFFILFFFILFFVVLFFIALFLYQSQLTIRLVTRFMWGFVSSSVIGIISGKFPFYTLLKRPIHIAGKWYQRPKIISLEAAHRLFGRFGKCAGCLLVIPAFLMVSSHTCKMKYQTR